MTTRLPLCRPIGSLLLTAALAAVAIPSSAQIPGSWELIDESSPGPSGRLYAGAAFDSQRNRLLVFGGYPGSLNDVWAFDLASDQWSPILPSGPPPSPRHAATAIYDALNDRLIVFGGFDDSFQRNEVWQLNLSGAPQWTQLLPSGAWPQRRSYHVAGYDAPRQRMIVFGGWNGSQYLGDLWSLSLSGSPAWTQLATSGPSPAPRALAGAAVDPTRDQLVVFGGSNGANLNDTWTLSLEGTPAWSAVATSGSPPPRHGVPIAYDSDNDRIVLFGGYDGSPRSDAWSLDLASPAWQEFTPDASWPAARYGHSTIFDPVHHRTILFGGSTGPLNTSEVLAFRPEQSPAWRSIVFLPRVRNYSVAFDPVARKLILFGGERQNGLTNDLFELDLASRTWVHVIPPGVPPSPRYAHRAAWDPVRDRMLMFGGNFQDLWEYRPRPSPTWTRLLPSGVPPRPRIAGGLVFDAAGDRLIGFGGLDGVNGGNLNDLWALPLSGPSSMTWETLSPSGTPPSPRWGHVMVADPLRQRVLVHGGGADVFHPLNDLHVLSLASNPPAWSTVSPANAPSPRTIHAGVIDPHHDMLLLYGGYSGNGPLNDAWGLPLSGGPWVRVDPVGPTLSPRYAIGAIYDAPGGRMVVPAGWDATRFLSDTWALRLDGPVAVQASLVEMHAEPDRVTLQWFVRDASVAAITVERRRGTEPWTPLGTPERVGTDRLAFEDRDVIAGEVHRYRLAVRQGGGVDHTDEIAVEVPSAHRLWLAGAWPNPSDGERMQVAFSLSRRSAGRLELFDIGGRQVAHRDLGSLPPGAHRVTFGDARLEPGVYVIRLAAEGRTLTAKALVVR